EMVSWKWLLNKKDITIVVAPEKGQDLAVREVSRRIMVLADRNSAAFSKQNSQRAERLQRIQGIKDEIAELEVVRDQKRNELDLAQVESQSRSLNENKSSVADGLAALASIKHFINRNQYRTIADAMRGDDKAHFIDKARLLADIINGMAETYEQDGKGMDATAYLHYFGGSKDWYITEKDSQGGTRQAFGWTGAGEGGELGYISIDDLTRSNIELDLYFDPKPLSGIVQDDAAEEASGESIAESVIKDGAMPVIELTGEELGEFPDTKDGMALRRVATKKFLEENIKGKWIECAAIGEKIELRQRGIDESINWSAKPKKLKALVAIEQIIRGATSPNYQSNTKGNKKPGVVEYIHLKNKVSIDGEVTSFRVVIERDTAGLLHYDLILDTKDAQTKAALDSSSAATVGQLIPDTKPGVRLEQNIVLDSAKINFIFDSASGLVLNLFIEGEEPGVIGGTELPTDAQLEDDLQQARELTDTDPTDEQKQSGDYQQGELSAFGLELAIENPKG
ncbi:MAG: hypothetical protein ACRDBT_11960, partial [Aeromonas sp.]